jgi:uncharacterized protein (TIGR02391 family)
MPSRRKASSSPPPVEIRDLSLEEIERGIVKLRRRVSEIEGIDPHAIRWDDQRGDTAAQNIRDAILEIFGPNSPEYRTNEYHRISDHTAWTLAGLSGPECQRHFAENLARSKSLLEGLISRLEEKRADLHVDTAGRSRIAFDSLQLHQRIADVSTALFRDGHYRQAVLDSCIALENLVKERSRLHDLSGVNLMQVAFSAKDPVLAFSDFRDQTERDEQQGMMHLFMGTVLAIRNPRAHSLLEDHPEIALQYIALVSLLAERVEATKRVK